MHLVELEMKQVCADVNVVWAAKKVYFMLCERMKHWEVQWNYNKTLNVFGIKGKQTRSSKPEVFVPVTDQTHVTPAWLQEVLAGFSDNEQKSVKLAIVDSTSAVLFYKASEGLVSCAPPEVLREKKSKCKAMQCYRRRRKKVKHQLVAAAIQDKKNALVEDRDRSQSEEI